MRPTTQRPNRSPGPTFLDRRNVLLLGTGLGVAALTGCSVRNPFTDQKTPAAEVIDDLAPDVAVAVEAVGLLLTATGLLSATVSEYPHLEGRLADTVRVHEAHLAALEAAVPDGVDARPNTEAPAAARTKKKAVALVARSEQDLHDGLSGLALRAESGPFARLLATMAAATAQQIAVLAR